MRCLGGRHPAGHGAGALLLAVSALAATPAARAADRPSIVQARSVFDRLPARDRNEAFLELMATGDFDAMASDQFGTRLYDATASFQERHGLPPSGVLTPETRTALSVVGGRIFNGWGLEFLDHPFASAALAVPGRFGLDSTTTGHGVAMENRRHTMSVSFAFFADGEATLQGVFDNLTRPAPGRATDLQVIRPDALAVATSTDTMKSYSRYIPVPGGIAGFTLSWNPSAFPNAGRVAVVMANELYPRRMVDGGDMFASLPGDASPISPGADAASVQRQKDAQEAAQRMAQQQVEQDRLQAQQRYLDGLRQQREADERRRVAEDDARQVAEERARVVREAEMRRKAQAETDRRIAMDKIREDRLTTAKASTDAALKDATDFIKSNRDDPQLMDHLQRISDLKVVSGGGEPDPIDRRRSELQAQLKADPVYAAWEARQVAEKQRDDERTLRDVVGALTVQRRFLVDRVADDPTSPSAAAFLSLAKRADAAIAAPSLDGAQSLMGSIDGAIETAGLHQSYALARADAGRSPGLDTAPAKP